MYVHLPHLVFIAEYFCSLRHAVCKEVYGGHVLNHLEGPAAWTCENTLLVLVVAWLR